MGSPAGPTNAKRADLLTGPSGAHADAASKTNGRESAMAKGQQRSSKEARKPKKEVTKKIAANPSTKGILKG
jgi:hypothetical protein